MEGAVAEKPSQAQKGAKEKKEKKKPAPVVVAELPEFAKKRLEMWNVLKSEHERDVAAREKSAIQITLPDGKQVEGTAWETTPVRVLERLPKALARSVVVARVDGAQLWDLGRPLERSCALELLAWDAPEARDVFWHSSAHILGQALERVYQGYLCTGPPIAGGGFFYDMGMEGKTVSPNDFPLIQKVVDDIVREKQPFERLMIPKERAQEMFGFSPFKSEILRDKVPDSDAEGVGSMCSVYRCGNLVDLCRGPHLLDTGKAAAFHVWKSSSSYWKGDSNNASLQRVYGISFPEKKLLEEWQKQQAALEAKSHTAIGTKQQLFFIEPQFSPGSTFWLPHGARIYNKLIAFLRNEYIKFGFEEVITPNLFNNQLWLTSGHFPKYEKDMFILDIDKEKYALKPMNCPSHCLMFRHLPRSHRELPIRFADFGVLHRNEESGALKGLTRVRRFQQDDAHIFCKESDIGSEIRNQLEFMKRVYGIFGYKFALELSTRPDNYLGELPVWDKAEAALERSLTEFGHPWTKDIGGGAFYGPKIDVKIQDSLGRSHQCATVQLDFQLPIRFELEYAGPEKNSVERPVIIHRAIYGSLERFIGILIEHLEGKWPFWLSPRQLMVIPVAKKFNIYAEEVQKTLVGSGFFAEVDLSGKTLDKKILEHSLYNYILVVGATEEQNKTVNVRKRKEEEDDVQVGREREVPLHSFIQELSEQVKLFH